MRLNIIPIGNSQGIRLPKTLIEQCGFGKTVEVEVTDHHLTIRPVINEPRKDWAKAFKAMSQNSDDMLLDLSNISHNWDKEEWKW
ncbi:MAG: AbrB/MazE/SpoVT family DNA-binding domain-containing protein [Proteobacteria bacterium]|nr:AbrB/MazE/SpoVT family DNA-binding domain-containing protein [Pseudomonadota bacterium]